MSRLIPTARIQYSSSAPGLKTPSAFFVSGGKSVFGAVKYLVTNRCAAELCGIHANSYGMAACPCCQDRSPAMKAAEGRSAVKSETPFSARTESGGAGETEGTQPSALREKRGQPERRFSEPGKWASKKRSGKNPHPSSRKMFRNLRHSWQITGTFFSSFSAHYPWITHECRMG